MSAEELANFVLSELKNGPIQTSESLLYNQQPIDQRLLQKALSTLTSLDFIKYSLIEREIWVLTEEGKAIAENGSHEAKVFLAIPPGELGITIEALSSLLGESAQIGQGKAFKNKWIGKSKEGRLIRLVDSIHDITKDQLLHISKEKTHPDANVLLDLKRRKLCTKEKITFYRIEKDKAYCETLVKQATDLTAEMLATGAWEKLTFKKYNFDALGQKPASGHLHPLMKVKEEFRKIFFELGFEEMPTNRYVELSFWNFDALFQPQQHPARDMQDTFYLKSPATSTEIPQPYASKVAEVHSKGGYGSLGYQYDWKYDEAYKLVLRTHTTAVSARMLYQLAQTGFQPAKYFSIDRVFRNETVDATHLAEFHQVEGVIADEGLTLAHLIGILHLFCSKLGVHQLRFKPTYNPYTEPSMEIFSYHEGLKKWVEIGNSGMFRPELLRPMGLPENVRVLAWGLSLERPTMIKYGINDIRALLGPKCDLDMIASNPICRLDKKMGNEV